MEQISLYNELLKSEQYNNFNKILFNAINFSEKTLKKL